MQVYQSRSHVLILKTNVMNEADRDAASSLMDLLFGKENWTIDLEDCDKVLRVCCEEDQTELLINSLKVLGFSGQVLDY